MIVVPPTLRTRRGRVALAAGAVAAVLALTGCGGDGESSVKLAQARVKSKERAVTKAEAQLTAASKAFCELGQDYLGSLDRYGDVLNATAPTVGDVKDAGADLAAPRKDAVDAAEAASAANQDLAGAEQELADAQAALARAQSGPSASPSSTASSSPSPTATPLAPAATVERVKQADSEFTTAQRAITDDTPLVQASQQFNSAAVALEMAWLALFADAGCLTDQNADAAAAAAAYTTALQQALSGAGYYDGKVDGVYGPETVKAVQALQKAHGLPVTGALDKATAAALQADLAAKGGAAAQQTLAATAAVQQTLKLAGYWDGPVDGTWTPALSEALKDFQRALGVDPTGTVDAATVTALEKAIEDTKKAETPPSAEPSSSPSTPAPTPTESPSASG